MNDIISNLKIKYEDIWKEYNIINTSIKLPITISIDAKEIKKIQIFESFVEDFDLVASFRILNLNSDYISYKIIFNGSPNTFFEEASKNKISLKKNNKNWIVQ